MDPASGFSAMRFLSFSNDKEDAEKEVKLKEAASKIEQAIARQKALGELIDYNPPTEETAVDPEDDTRSLYDRLLEQKDKKKDAIEESQKLSNLVRTLDEEDVNYLNEVARNKQEEELKKRLEVYDALEGRKRFSEKRTLDEEKKMKESLISSKLTGSSSSLKSKLLSRIRIKPKTSVIVSPVIDYNPSDNQGQKSNSDGQTKDSAKRSIQSTEEADKQGPCSDEPEDRTAKSKRQKTDGKRKESDDDEQNGGQDQTPERTTKDTNCHYSSKNVMKCIGILPSLPQVRNYRDSSEDSDNSDDDINRRIVPRVRRRK